MKRLIALVLVAIVFTACSMSMKLTPRKTENITTENRIELSLAASLETIFKKEIIPGFLKDYPNYEVVANYGGSGKIARQIQEGMRTDIFLSASNKWMDELIKSKAVEIGDSKPYLKNKLVLISPKGDSRIGGLKEVDNSSLFVIGDPNIVPAGSYAMQVFNSIGISKKELTNLSLATDVTQVLNQVSTKSASLGIVYLTDALQKKDSVDIVEIFDDSLLDEPITYPIAILRQAKDKKAAKDFIKYLLKPETKKKFLGYGFIID